MCLTPGISLMIREEKLLKMTKEVDNDQLSVITYFETSILIMIEKV